MASQGDILMAAKARNQKGGVGFRDTYSQMQITSEGTTQYHFKGSDSASSVSAVNNPLGRDASYEDYDNDANFDPTLSNQDAAYFSNFVEENPEDRWASGGGIQAGEAKGIHAGRTRDTDGTVDRVKDPPKDLLPLLYAAKMMCSAYNIDLHGVFQEAGGTTFGTMTPTKFGSALIFALHRMNISEELLARIIHAYGCGAETPKRSAMAKMAPFEAVAWHDFVEDVEKAVDVDPTPFTHPGGPPPLNR